MPGEVRLSILTYKRGEDGSKLVYLNMCFPWQFKGML